MSNLQNSPDCQFLLLNLLSKYLFSFVYLSFAVSSQITLISMMFSRQVYPVYCLSIFLVSMQMETKFFDQLKQKHNDSSRVAMSLFASFF